MRKPYFRLWTASLKDEQCVYVPHVIKRDAGQVRISTISLSDCEVYRLHSNEVAAAPNSLNVEAEGVVRLHIAGIIE